MKLLGRLRRPLAVVLLVGGNLLPSRAQAVPVPAKGKAGLEAARKGDCVSAVPLLEASELERHSPVAAFELAKCYVALGRLLEASALFHAIAGEAGDRPWTGMDRIAILQAASEAKKTDERIPTLSFAPAEAYEDLRITVDGKEVTDPKRARQVPPDTSLVIEATAKGRAPFATKVVLSEGEVLVLDVELEPVAKAPPKAPKAEAPETPEDGRATTWLGGRFRGIILPSFLMNAFVDGGTTVFIPGGDLTLTTALDDADLVLSLGYASYRMGETVMKPAGTPVTDYEIVESDLMALQATLELMWSVPLSDDGSWAFRIGGGIGVGWTFFGDVLRTQAYPEGGQEDVLESYRKCDGPNDPPGTFRFCNQLDQDADHYDGYAEPSWFDGGARPLVYPWLALPQLELTWYPTDDVALDLGAGLSTSGILTSLGVRFGL